MRKIKINLGLIFILAIMASCGEWLDVTPESEVSKDEMFKLEEGYRDVLIGLYASMDNPSTYGKQLTFGAIDMMAQLYIIPSTDILNNEFSSYNFENAGVENVINNVWKRNYNVIANCNILLDHIEKADPLMFQPHYQELFKAEALALRAFLHFDLLRLFHPSYGSSSTFKGIPFVEKYGSSVTDQASTEEVLTKIIRDLKIAKDLLKEHDPIVTGEDLGNVFEHRRYKMNYYAVSALLARVMMYQGDREGAIVNAIDVIENSGFSLVEVKHINNKYDFLFESEQIFSLSSEISGYEGFFENYRRMHLEPGTISEDKPGHTVILSLFEGHDPDDVRSKEWYFDYLIGTNKRAVLAYKFYRERDSKEKQYPDGAIPLIRLSEMYLIAAEAYAYSDMNEAVRYINLLKLHRNAVQLPVENSYTSETFMDEVTKEYERDFIGEGQVFFYYKRRNFSTIKLAGGEFQSMTDKQYTFPVPTDEITFGGGMQDLLE